ncbi:hypothetical protein WKH31_20550 [Metabacillus indicus]|uniref:hypothetical protein n=1 Tax=Metabacillus indicus TaxID=246786 RepID=UPI00316FA28A
MDIRDFSRAARSITNEFKRKNRLQQEKLKRDLREVTAILKQIPTTDPASAEQENSPQSDLLSKAEGKLQLAILEVETDLNRHILSLLEQLEKEKSRLREIDFSVPSRTQVQEAETEDGEEPEEEKE